MRIPFDLIAVILCADRIGDYLSHEDWDPARIFQALWVWPLFLFGSWLFHELATRLTERRLKKALPSDSLHPSQFYNRCTLIAQGLSVALYAWATWYLNWPMAVSVWPTWFGLPEGIGICGFVLAKSVVMSSLLIVGPYLVSMVLSWIPRRRWVTGSRNSKTSLWAYLSFEAKLTWLPICTSFVFAIISDISQFLPQRYTVLLESEPTQSIFLISMVALIFAVLMPLAAVTLWDCQPLPEGELKDRMDKLVARSGVKTRAILVWGSRNTGFLNACVMGPWSRFRYVLISPLLADTLTVDETEAVLGHELGHARYGHMTLFVAVLMTIITLITGLYNLFSQGWSAFPLVQIAGTMAVLIAFIYFFFGAVSRQCEREADLASAELIGTPTPLITALEKVGERTGNSRSVPCWHHGSIADRITALVKLSSDPGESLRFHARQKWIRVGFIGLAVALIAAQLFFHG